MPPRSPPAGTFHQQIERSSRPAGHASFARTDRSRIAREPAPRFHVKRAATSACSVPPHPLGPRLASSVGGDGPRPGGPTCPRPPASGRRAVVGQGHGDVRYSHETRALTSTACVRGTDVRPCPSGSASRSRLAPRRVHVPQSPRRGRCRPGPGHPGGRWAGSRPPRPSRAAKRHRLAHLRLPCRPGSVRPARRCRPRARPGPARPFSRPAPARRGSFAVHLPAYLRRSGSGAAVMPATVRRRLDLPPSLATPRSAFAVRCAPGLTARQPVNAPPPTRSVAQTSNRVGANGARRSDARRTGKMPRRGGADPGLAR